MQRSRRQQRSILLGAGSEPVAVEDLLDRTADMCGVERVRRPRWHGRTDQNLQHTVTHRQLEGGFYYASRGQDPSNGVCTSHAMVRMSYQKSDMPGWAKDTVSAMNMEVVNFQLLASGAEASHAMPAKAVTDLENKRASDAQKRGGPKF
jgi:hypothetical protein